MTHDRAGKYAPQNDESQGGLLGSLLRMLVPIAVIGIGVAGLRNVFSDAFEVQRMAMDKACAEQSSPCRAQMTQWERTPIGQTFEMLTPGGTVIVRCQREYILVGRYRCSPRDMPAAITAEPPAPAPHPPVPTTAKSARPVTTQ